MVINGKDRAFKLTVGAAMDIAELCPSRDISKIEAIIATNDTVKQMRNVASIAISMNKWAELSKPEEERQAPLTEEEVFSLDISEFAALSDAIKASFEVGQNTNIKAKPIENKKKEEAAIS